MAVLVCNTCGGKVQSNKCCGKPMKLEGTTLKCESCGKTVEVNYCCNNPMHEHHEHKH